MFLDFLDFNHDGNVDPTESLLGFLMWEEMQEEDTDDTDRGDDED